MVNIPIHSMIFSEGDNFPGHELNGMRNEVQPGEMLGILIPTTAARWLTVYCRNGRV